MVIPLSFILLSQQKPQVNYVYSPTSAKFIEMTETIVLIITSAIRHLIEL